MIGHVERDAEWLASWSADAATKKAWAERVVRSARAHGDEERARGKFRGMARTWLRRAGR